MTFGHKSQTEILNYKLEKFTEIRINMQNRVTVRLDKDLASLLNETKVLGYNISSIIRLALKEYLTNLFNITSKGNEKQVVALEVRNGVIYDKE